MKGRTGLRRSLAVFLWPLFRTPEPGWRRHAVAALLGLIAVLVAAFSWGEFTGQVRFKLDPHAAFSLEQALVLHFCDKYGYRGPALAQKSDGIYSYHSVRITTHHLVEIVQPNDRFADRIIAATGSVAAWCDGIQPFFNSENGLFLLDTLLLSFPPGDSPNSLALKMKIFRCALVFGALYVIALSGAGLLPLLLISLAAVRVVGISEQTHILSVYPTMMIIILSSTAVLVLLLQVIKGGRYLSIAVSSVAFGLLLGFIYNFRTSYGFSSPLRLRCCWSSMRFGGRRWQQNSFDMRHCLFAWQSRQPPFNWF